MRLRNLNYESSTVTNFYIDRNYFKGKILVFYKLKTMITGDD